MTTRSSDQHDSGTPAQRPFAADSDGPELLLRRLDELRSACLHLERSQAARLASIHPASLDSGRNLLHYLALRRADLRSLQPLLSELGLSSLGRSESHVLASLRAVSRCLRGLAGSPGAEPLGCQPASSGELFGPVTMRTGRELLARATERLLGATAPGRTVRIMVTLPTEAAEDPRLVGALLDAGMTVARINSAHDSPAQWRRMVAHVREQSARRGVECRTLFDLAGPKLRTGPIASGPEVLRVAPVLDPLGKVVRPREITLVPVENGPSPHGALPVPAEFLESLRAGDQLEFEDSRGKHRAFTIDRREPDGGVVAQISRSAYFISGTILRTPSGATAAVGKLPPIEQSILLRPGDMLRLRRDASPGHPTGDGRAGEAATIPSIGCTLPEALPGLTPGQAVWFDDGKIGALVVDTDEAGLNLRITDASPGGDRLRADKGINLPDTAMRIDGLTEQDLAALPFAAAETDMIGMSFVQSAADVHRLAAELGRLGGSRTGIILKIETRRAFESLPDLLLAAMERPAVGVMIARGDLAVEMGYGRLAEVQEEILWMCEAAHVPVVWATQVLETLAKKGRPSRAEVTDAAMAVRAECVMLNKGPYILEAVRFLDGVLRRMQEHQSKKSPMLRALAIAKRFGGGATRPTGAD